MFFYRHALANGLLFRDIHSSQQDAGACGLLGEHPPPGIDDGRMPEGLPSTRMHAP